MQELFDINVESWRKDLELNEENLKQYGETLPEGIRKEHEDLKSRLGM